MNSMKGLSPRSLPAFLALIVLFFSACDSSRIYEENLPVPESGWKSDHLLNFDVNVEDPSTPANFYINVRHADGYPYSNLFLFIKTKFPDGKSSVDTLECILADEKGKWIGNGLGDIYDNQIPFKRNVRFPQAGNYHFEIGQGMRQETLPLILDVGLRIEKAQ